MNHILHAPDYPPENTPRSLIAMPRVTVSPDGHGAQGRTPAQAGQDAVAVWQSRPWHAARAIEVWGALSQCSDVGRDWPVAATVDEYVASIENGIGLHDRELAVLKESASIWVPEFLKGSGLKFVHTNIEPMNAYETLGADAFSEMWRRIYASKKCRARMSPALRGHAEGKAKLSAYEETIEGQRLIWQTIQLPTYLAMLSAIGLNRSDVTVCLSNSSFGRIGAPVYDANLWQQPQLRAPKGSKVKWAGNFQFGASKQHLPLAALWASNGGPLTYTSVHPDSGDQAERMARDGCKGGILWWCPGRTEGAPQEQRWSEQADQAALAARIAVGMGGTEA